MIPEPSRHPFRFPLPAEALPYFCHPTRQGFTEPVRHPDGRVYAASGFVCFRVSRFQGMPSDYPEASPEFIKKVDALPWAKFLPDPNQPRAAEWRKMDDSRATIYSGGALPLWIEERKKPPIYNRDTLVVTAGGPLVPLAMLQLLARLPKAEVRMTYGYDVPLLVRCSGDGEVIIPAIYPDMNRAPGPKFALFKERDSSNPLGSPRF